MKDIFSQIKIIFEDENFLVIDKPAGLLVHPTAQKNSAKPTLIDWLLSFRPEIKAVGEDNLRPGLVHRLDRETSGLLIIAKNQETFLFFKKLFQERKIKKGYLALVYGVFKNKTGSIRKPIGLKASSLKRSTKAKRLKNLKEAITDYKVVWNFKNQKGPGFALLEVFPKTGRTNQIRVHFSNFGHPLVGDQIYGSKKLDKLFQPPRLFLHAYLLEFPLQEGKILRLESDLPKDLQNFLRRFPALSLLTN